jgi:hypothetical protein
MNFRLGKIKILIFAPKKSFPANEKEFCKRSESDILIE